MYKKASSTLLEINKQVSLRFHVNLTTKGKDGITEVPDAFFTVYTNSLGEYITYQVKSFATLEMKDDRPWNKSKSIAITPNNIFEVMSLLDITIGLIYEPETFFYDSDNELKVNVEHVMKAKSPTGLIKDGIIGGNLGHEQSVEIIPGVIYDNFEDDTYEGAFIALNNRSNTFPIVIGKLEALKYAISKIDFTLYTDALLNIYFHTLYEKGNRLKVENAPPRVNVFAKTKSDEDPKMIEQKSITGPNNNKDEVSAKDLLDI